MNMELVSDYEENQQDSKKTDQTNITISPAVVNSLGASTAMVEKGPLTPTILIFPLSA